MKLFTWIGLLALLTCVLAWTKEDHEIFDLVSALESSEGKGTTFYSFLGVGPSAQLKEINKQYRKRSLELHPDKNPNVKDIHARFARLGTITEILRDAAKRTRYDFFFKNGVPKWRGTGYYYSRFRPSIIHVLVFLVAVSSLIHYLILRVNYRRDQQRIEYFTRVARAKAGSSGSLISGTATPTAEMTNGRESVLASVVEQITADTVPDEPAAQAISKRQAKIQAREAKKDKTKRDHGVSPAPSGAVTPNPPAPVVNTRRRKVRVPMVEGSEYSPSLDLVVVDDEVFIPDGSDLTPLTTLARPVSLDALWPVASYKYLVAKFFNKNTEHVEAGSDEDEQVSGDDDNDAAVNGDKTMEKPKRKMGTSAGGKLAAMRRRKATLK
ncbi:hypothetical protein QFC22_000762 [Naganishia vaughanmartiniae]|uniref:Uncharacterized protein n=1 Tax=Naganishia vaughanmartiniae TaxID=1424756 RepID=A0ACC2XLQ6_9TREE|nr:hypothetical protein QFC22_000762 [Naganishia vaughanmartiniae]